MELEPDLVSLTDGERADVVAVVNYVGPGFSALTSAINKINFFTDVRITSATQVTLFGMKKFQVMNQCWLLRTQETTVVEHQVKDVASLPVITKVCSGISAVSTGYEACGAQVTAGTGNCTL